MVVNSLSFLVFFLVVFVVYYLPLFKKNARFQNIWLFITSYFFYGYADWRMIPLLLGATVVFYLLGLWLKKEMNNGRNRLASWITIVGVLLGVGVLLYFKYLNFFADSFATLLNSIGLHVTWTTLHIVMPIGVSFFTFKLISYVIEIHREHIDPSKDFIEFGTYIAFFPTILSGPIDRPAKFIPQLSSVRTLDYDFAVDGCRQILWGMFKKMVIADNCAMIVDECWGNLSGQSSLMLVVTMFVYMIQMYADFSGYSDMAIGVGKLLGIRIAENFRYPLFATNMAEYWRRWHMSLTSWLTDYVFMPLNVKFRDLANLGIILAIIINMLVVGFWHGANWTFGVFGLYHGLLFIPLILSGSFFKKTKMKTNAWDLPSFSDASKMLLTVTLAAFGLVIFRADNVAQAFQYVGGMFSFSGIGLENEMMMLRMAIFTLLMLAVEWRHRKSPFGLDLTIKSHVTKFVVYLFLIAMIFIYGGNAEQFIYFQF